MYIFRQVLRYRVLMNVQFPLVVSDITGVTGLRILRDIVAGRTDPHALAQRFASAAALTTSVRRRLHAELDRVSDSLLAYERYDRACQCAGSWRPCTARTTISSSVARK